MLPGFFNVWDNFDCELYSLKTYEDILLIYCYVEIGIANRNLKKMLELPKIWVSVINQWPSKVHILSYMPL